MPLRTTIGAMTSVQDLVELASPLGQCAANDPPTARFARRRPSAEISALPSGETPRAATYRRRFSRSTPKFAQRAPAASEPTRSRTSSPTGTAGWFSTSASKNRPRVGSPGSTARTRTTTPPSPSCAARTPTERTRIAVAGVNGPAVRLPSAEAKADVPAARGMSPHSGRDLRGRRPRLGVVPRAERCPC